MTLKMTIEDNMSKEKEVSNKEDASEVYLRKIGGFDLLTRRPLITKNNKYFFVISDCFVRKYAAENGNLLNEYYFDNRRAIVALQEKAENAEEILIAFEDGMLICWNYVNNFKTTESFIQLPEPDSSVVFFQQISNIFYFILKTKKRCLLYYSDPHRLDSAVPLNKGDGMNFEEAPHSIAFGPTSKVAYVALLNRFIMFVYELPSDPNVTKCQVRKHCVNSEKNLTSVTFHPTDNVIATGDSIGCIIIWNNIMDPMPLRTMLHWHSQPVADLAFTPGGTYLYSGGAEMVLVKWNLVGQHYGEKNFLSRLGSPIRYITVDESNQLLVTSHEDQTLQVVDSQMNGIRSVIEGMTLGSGNEAHFSDCLHFNKRLGAMALKGRVGHVQFYNGPQQKQLYQLDIVQQNVVSAVNVGPIKERFKLMDRKTGRLTNKTYPIEVTKVAVSDDGNWLATVEHRDDTTTSPEIRLKFWWLRKNMKFELNTTIHLPHNDEINFISFSPLNEEVNSQYLITTSKDKMFKLWDLNREEKGTNVKQWWNCSRKASLNNHSIPRMATFSSDLSLLAVLFDQTITLWELDSPTTIRYIPRLDIFPVTSLERVNSIIFGHGNLSHNFIICCSEKVKILNAARKFFEIFTFVRRGPKPYLTCCYNRYEQVLALISQQYIEFLDLQSRHITMRIELDRGNIFQGTMVGALFSPEQPTDSNTVLKRSTFYCLNEKQELYKMVSKSAFYESDCSILVAGINAKPSEILPDIYRDSTPLAMLLNKSKSNQLSETGFTANNYSTLGVEQMRKTLVQQFFNEVPSHVLPPIGMLEKSFLKAYFECFNCDAENKNQSIVKHSEVPQNISEPDQRTESERFLEEISFKSNLKTLPPNDQFSWLNKYLQHM